MENAAERAASLVSPVVPAKPDTDVEDFQTHVQGVPSNVSEFLRPR
jgi:hypothetical protein